MQIAPFVYLLLISVCLLTESVLPDWALRIFDNLLDVPVYAPIGFLFLGRMLKLLRKRKNSSLSRQRRNGTATTA